MNQEQRVILINFIQQQGLSFTEVFMALKALITKKKEQRRLEELSGD